jgi:hypothetical protein
MRLPPCHNLKLLARRFRLHFKIQQFPVLVSGALLPMTLVKADSGVWTTRSQSVMSKLAVKAMVFLRALAMHYAFI